MKGAFETGVYRNVFLENGYTQEEIDKRLRTVSRPCSMDQRRNAFTIR